MLRSSIQLRWEVLKVSHKTSWSHCWRDDRSSLWFYTPPFQLLREIADILMGLVWIRLSLNLQDHTKDGGCTTHHNRLHELFCGWRWGSDLAWGVIKNDVGGKGQKGCWVALQKGKAIKHRSFSRFVRGCYDKLTRSLQVSNIGEFFGVSTYIQLCSFCTKNNKRLLHQRGAKRCWVLQHKSHFHLQTVECFIPRLWDVRRWKSITKKRPMKKSWEVVEAEAASKQQWYLFLRISGSTCILGSSGSLQRWFKGGIRIWYTMIHLLDRNIWIHSNRYMHMKYHEICKADIITNTVDSYLFYHAFLVNKCIISFSCYWLAPRCWRSGPSL